MSCRTCKFRGDEKVLYQGKIYRPCTVAAPTKGDVCVDNAQSAWIGSWPWTHEAQDCGEWVQKPYSEATRAVIGQPTFE